MVVRLRIRVCRGGSCIETIGIANSGFAGRDPEITLPQHMARELFGEELRLVLVERVLADGSRTALARTVDQVDVYVVAEDRVEGPVKAYAYITRGGPVLINDNALSRLRIVIIDPLEGVWCFRDEVGRRERRTPTLF